LAGSFRELAKPQDVPSRRQPYWAGMEVSEWEAIEAGYVPTDTGRLRAMAGP